MKEAGLPPDLSSHSFRVTTITDLLDQQLPLEDVQDLAGHADHAPRGSMIAHGVRSRGTLWSGYGLGGKLIASHQCFDG
jgi:integrase